MKDRLHRSWSWWLQHPGFDWPIAALGLLALWYGPGHLPSGFQDGTARAALFQSVAALSAIVAAYAGVALALYLSATGERISMLVKRFGVGVNRGWAGIVEASLVAALLQLVALSGTAAWTGWCALFGILLLLGAGVRMIALTIIVMRLVDADRTEPLTREPPRVL